MDQFRPRRPKSYVTLASGYHLVGDWRSQRHPFSFNQSCQVTVVDGVILHVLYAMPNNSISYAEIANQVTAVTHLGSGRALPFHQDQHGRLIIDDLPPQVDHDIAITLRIDVFGEPQAISEQEVSGSLSKSRTMDNHTAESRTVC